MRLPTRWASSLPTVLCLCLSPPVAAQVAAVSLVADLSSPQPAGTAITFTASATTAAAAFGECRPSGSGDPDAAASGTGTFEYRFSAQGEGGPERLVRDFSPASTLRWVRLDEGSFTIAVTARERESATTTARATLAYALTARASSTPSVALTSHPLVGLWAAPASACPAGSALRVEHRPAGTADPWQVSPWKPCTGTGVNEWVAGLRAGATYDVRHTVRTGGVATSSSSLPLATGAPPSTLPVFSVTAGPTPSTSAAEGLLFVSSVPGDGGSPIPMAVDLEGNAVWYDPAHASKLLVSTTFTSEGTLLEIAGEPGGDQGQYLREVDLAGNVVRETSIARVREQLSLPPDVVVGAFDHEAIRFPDGRTLVQCTAEKRFTGVQGPGNVDVLGAVVVALDRDWQVVWSWNAFAHLDVSRKATLNERCVSNAPGCPPLLLDAVANDWLHLNALAPTADGHLIASLRHQDWVVKLDYANGSGTGAVLWRLGKDGDFTTPSPDPYPWFSHQHGAVLMDGSTLSLFDNGNVRCQGQQDCPSRGMVWELDENARSAGPSLSAALPYSLALGSSQRLSNGSYAFTSGSQELLRVADLVELTPAGATSLTLHTEAAAYRGYRQRSLHRHTLDGSLAPEVVSLPPLSRSRGTSASATLLLVDDPDSSELSVGITYLPEGISLSSLAFSGGEVTGTLGASCGAATGARLVGLFLSDGRSFREVLVPVSITGDTTPPIVMPPPGVVVEQTLCDGTRAGATPATSADLSAFLAGGSAADACGEPTARLTPEVDGVDVTAGSFFAAGSTAVTFRFEDGEGNVGSALSTVSVRRRGDVDGSGLVDVLDVVTLASAIVGNVSPGVAPYTASLTTGDANADGVLDVFDLQLQQALVVGNVGCLPTS